MPARVPRFALPPVAVFLAARGGFAFAFAAFATVSNLRRAVDLGFDPLELVLVGTVLEAATFLLEVPTGAVADVYGRRRSVIVGYALVGVGFAAESFATGLAGVLAAQVVWGGGWTFVSGARSAWLADEVGEVEAARLQLRGAQVSQACALAGIAAASLLGSAALALPMRLAGAVLLASALFLGLCMAERGFVARRESPAQGFAVLGRTLAQGLAQVRRRPVLGTLLAIAALSGAASEGFDRLWEIHLLANARFPGFGDWPAVVWFGVLRATVLVVSLGAVTAVRRAVDPGDLARLPRVLGALHVALAAGMAAFAWSGRFGVALLAYLAISVLRQVIAPLYAGWVNRRLDPRSRATVLSLVSQGDALGQVLGGPALGALGRGAGVRAALVGATCLLAPVVALLAGAARRGEPPPATAAPAAPRAQ